MAHKFYVVEYPNSDANEGRVIWASGSNIKTEVQTTADALKQRNPEKDYEVSDLPEAEAVFIRDAKPFINN